MKKDVEYFRALSEKIDELYYSGKKEEGAAELKMALSEAEGVNESYRLFFEGELAGYIENDLPKQEKLFRQALNIAPEDFFLLRNLGVVLEKKGKEYDAIKIYNQALEINPKDYHTLRQKGVFLSKQGKEEEAIKVFDKAIEINPRDYSSLRQKGVSLSKLGKEMEAERLFDQALEIMPKDYFSLIQKGVTLAKQKRFEKANRQFGYASDLKPDYALIYLAWSVSLFLSGHWNEAWEKISRAYELDPDDENNREAYEYLAKYLKKEIKLKRVIRGEASPSPDEPAKISGLRAVVDLVRSNMGPKVDKFLEIMRSSRERTEDFLKSETNLIADSTFFLVLRKWNSYTPIIPATGEERYVGGGYFLLHNGRGVVVDPGYNFIENFFKAVGRVHDIHDIVLTHAHNDHTMDFESLLSLVYQYNKRKKETDANYKKIRVYANMGSLIKFSGLLDLRGAPYLERVIALEPGHRHDLGDGLVLNVLDAYHDETVTTKYSVGLEFVLQKDGKPATNIVITSDTGLFPQRKQDGGDKIVADTKQPEIWSTYKLSQTPADLLIAHLGSIREEEFKTSIDSKEEEIYYPNHLGILGVARVITALRPNLALVSEFGEELKDIRENLIDMLCKIIEEYFSDGNGKPNVMPADIPFIYDMRKNEVYCVLSEKMVPAENITYSCPSDDTFFYHNKNTTEKIEKMEKKGKAFTEACKKRSLPYFAKKPKTT